MKILVLVVMILGLGINSVLAGGDCEVVDYSTYQEVRGSGGYDSSVDIYTVWCASFTIKNTSGEGRFDPIIKATLVDGKTKEKKIKTSELMEADCILMLFLLGTHPSLGDTSRIPSSF
ncbi:MAG: hypothetical protein AABY78_03180 [Nitrospirota bacterium]